LAGWKLPDLFEVIAAKMPPLLGLILQANAAELAALATFIGSGGDEANAFF